MVRLLEALVFRTRVIILALLAAFTVYSGYYATQLRMDAGFDKQLPQNHEYINTFTEYRDRLFGSNRIIVVVEAKEEGATIWNKDFFTKLKEVTDDIFFLPGVDRRTVTSLWTPNTRYIEITEEGLTADDVIPGTVTANSMTEQDLAQIENNVVRGGFVGRLVSNDFTAAMIVAELLEFNPETQQRLDYFDLADKLEAEIREKHQSDRFDIRIIGFAKMIGDIADGAASVVSFFAVAFVLTALAVYLYAQSWVLVFLALFCSLTSVVWQFGILAFLGYGLDPLAILVPFLVFAIGVSHGVQQINLISKEITSGKSSEEAARSSFSGLLIPGSMALVTDLVGFGTLYIIPIAMVQELAITASIGVALKIITNLIMLPILASYFQFDDKYVHRVERSREIRMAVMRVLGKIAEPKAAVVVLIASVALFAVAVWQSQGRHVGDLHAGAPELRPDARYNVDSVEITKKFSLGLDLLTVVVETPSEACIKYEYMKYLNQFSWYMENVPGVTLVASAPFATKQSSSGWNEGNLKWKALPRNTYALVQAVGPIPPSSGLLNQNCTLLPLLVFLEDHKATTINTVIDAVKTFRTEYARDDVTIRLASGNVGVQAAVNEEIEQSELPMMIYVYLVIIALVFITYRDWRATIVCCLPLTLATFLGYWFMKELEIGLKVATLPVMVLAVGLGVDYAFYIYNRLQAHLADGMNVTQSYQQALLETGNAVVFTALTMAIGVSTWSFSPLKFQADMGLLLTFMFMTNMIMSITALPALAVVLDMVFPRRGPVKAPSGALAH